MLIIYIGIERKTIENFYPYEKEFENKLDINEVWDTRRYKWIKK